MADVDIIEWARLQGMHSQTASRWLWDGKLPVLAARVDSRPVLAGPDGVIAGARDRTGLCGRVSSHGQRAGLDRQVTCRTVAAGERASIARAVALARAAFLNAAGKPGLDG